MEDKGRDAGYKMDMFLLKVDADGNFPEAKGGGEIPVTMNQKNKV